MRIWSHEKRARSGFDAHHGGPRCHSGGLGRIIAAPGAREGLKGIVSAISYGMKHPFKFRFVPDTFTSVLVCIGIYAIVAIVVVTSSKGYRRGEEYGSAKWGNPIAIDRKYRDRKNRFQNQILSRTVAMGNSEQALHRHQRNNNVVVIGGSGSGKTRAMSSPTFCKGKSPMLC